jgi:hypothetical protein
MKKVTLIYLRAWEKTVSQGQKKPQAKDAYMRRNVTFAYLPRHYPDLVSLGFVRQASRRRGTIAAEENQASIHAHEEA